MKYTRGQWKADGLTIRVAGHGVVVTQPRPLSADEGVEFGNNARLIVAAVNGCASVNADHPLAVAESIKEMYEALLAARYRIETLAMVTGYEGEAHFPTLEQINKAIAKAEAR